MAHCACVSSQSLFPPALETLHQPATYDHLHTVVDATMALTLLLHLLIALAGYLRHGDAVDPNILDALPQTPAVAAARLAIVFAFAFTYPMMIFLCRMHIGAIAARRARAPLTPAPSAANLQALSRAVRLSGDAEVVDPPDEPAAGAGAGEGEGEGEGGDERSGPQARPFGGEEDHVVVTVLLVGLSLVAAVPPPPPAAAVGIALLGTSLPPCLS